MKGKKTLKLIAMCCMLALLLAGMNIPVCAAEEGSLKLKFPVEAAGLEMTLYQVAQLGEGSFLYNEDFAECEIAVEDFSDSEAVQEAADKLADYTAEKKLEGTTEEAADDGTVIFTGLEPALYLAVQTAGEEYIISQAVLVPIPFMEDGQEKMDAEIAPKYAFSGGAVIVNKIDENGNALGQAQFVLQEKVYDGRNYYWKETAASLTTDDNGQIAVTDMPKGDYRFIETDAPEGYVLEDGVYEFSITQAGQIVTVDGLYKPGEGQVAELEVVNNSTSVSINKVDENGNPVAGAKLVIKDAEGKVITDEAGKAKYSFITTETPTELRGLPAGEYYVCELEAPDGYKVAQDVKLTISDQKGAVNEVTMVDERNPEEGTLNVRKYLIDEGDKYLGLREGVFYVALFADEAFTERVTNVLPIYFKNDTSSTATFSGLEADTSYYVSETDEHGTPIVSEETDAQVFAPEYPNGQVVEIAWHSDDAEYEFYNRYYEIPDGFYHTGEITITKNVLKGGEPYETDETYYAGIFTDPEYTNLYGEVIPLEMDGRSSFSQTVTVEVPEEGESVIYYVTETDENGNPLVNNENISFTFSLLNDRVEMTIENDKEEVIITNEYPDITVTPTPEPTVTPGITETPDTPEDPEPDKPDNSTPVKTGDNTPIGVYAAVLMIAAFVIVVIWYRKKKK